LHFPALFGFPVKHLLALTSILHKSTRGKENTICPGTPFSKCVEENANIEIAHYLISSSVIKEFLISSSVL